MDGTEKAGYDYIGSRVGRRSYAAADVNYDITYNSLGRATRHYTYKNGSPATTIVDFTYSFDDNGNITEQSFDHR